MAGEPKEGGQSGPLLSRRDLLILGGGAAAGAVGGTWAVTRNSDRKGTGRDPGAAPAGNNGSAPGQSEETPGEETTEDEPGQDRETIDITTPVDAPFYDDSVRNADIQDFHSDTEELRDAVEQGGHTGAVQIGRLFEGQTDAESAYAAAQILHTDPDLATDYVIDTIPGQINASNREYIFIQPVEDGELLAPVVAGQAYNGFEVYNPENPEASSYSMREKLLRDGGFELSFNHQMNSIKRDENIVREKYGGTPEDIGNIMETFMRNWSASMLGVSEEDDVKLRPVSYEDGFIQGVSRGVTTPEVPEELDGEISDGIAGQDIPYSVAEGLQEEYRNSEHYDNGQWTGFEIEIENGEADYNFQDIDLRASL